MSDISIGGYRCTKDQFDELLDFVASDGFQGLFVPVLDAYVKGYQEKYARTVPADNVAIFEMGECKGRAKQCAFFAKLKDLMLNIKQSEAQVEESVV